MSIPAVGVGTHARESCNLVHWSNALGHASFYFTMMYTNAPNCGINFPSFSTSFIFKILFIHVLGRFQVFYNSIYGLLRFSLGLIHKALNFIVFLLIVQWTLGCMYTWSRKVALHHSLLFISLLWDVIFGLIIGGSSFVEIQTVVRGNVSPTKKMNCPLVMNISAQ